MDLHWLPVARRIQFKVLLMVFKGLNGLAPPYISELMVKKTESYCNLRSNDNHLLVVPISSSKYGDRNFRHVGPKLWNNLPIDMRLCSNVKSFKKMLKTLLFQEEYGAF